MVAIMTRFMAASNAASSRRGRPFHEPLPRGFFGLDVECTVDKLFKGDGHEEYGQAYKK